MPSFHPQLLILYYFVIFSLIFGNYFSFIIFSQFLEGKLIQIIQATIFPQNKAHDISLLITRSVFSYTNIEQNIFKRVSVNHNKVSLKKNKRSHGLRFLTKQLTSCETLAGCSTQISFLIYKKGQIMLIIAMTGVTLLAGHHPTK